MKELIERAAEELLNAAARLQELALNMEKQGGGTTLDLQNLSPEDEEVLAQLFNAWTQKNIISDLDEIKEKVDSVEHFVHNAPPPEAIAEVVEAVQYRDLDKLDKLDQLPDFDDYDLDEMKSNAEDAIQGVSGLREQFEEFASELGPLKTLAEFLNLEVLIDTLKSGIEAQARSASEQQVAGNGA